MKLPFTGSHITISYDGAKILCLSNNKALECFDANNMNMLWTNKNVPCCTSPYPYLRDGISSNNKYIYYSCCEHHKMFFDIETGNKLFEIGSQAKTLSITLGSNDNVYLYDFEERQISALNLKNITFSKLTKAVQLFFCKTLFCLYNDHSIADHSGEIKVSDDEQYIMIKLWKRNAVHVYKKNGELMWLNCDGSMIKKHLTFIQNEIFAIDYIFNHHVFIKYNITNKEMTMVSKKALGSHHCIEYHVINGNGLNFILLEFLVMDENNETICHHVIINGKTMTTLYERQNKTSSLLSVSITGKCLLYRQGFDIFLGDIDSYLGDFAIDE